MISSSSRTQSTSVEGVSVLGMLWIGAHTHNLRERFTIINHPSLEMLRSIGLFDICLANVKGSSDSDSGSRFMEDRNIEGSASRRLLSLLKSEEDIQHEGIITILFVRSLLTKQFISWKDT